MAKKPVVTDRAHAVEYIHTPDSVALSVNAKGEHSWTVKIYFDSEGGRSKTATDRAMARARQMDKALRKMYG